MTADLVIDETNFNEYFKDVRRYPIPEKGDVMVVYRAVAYLEESFPKTNLVDLLLDTEKARPAVQVMSKIFCACEADSIAVPKAITEDLLSGMSREEVIKKPYKYTFEMFFYTKKEYVPDDGHWDIITLMPSSGDSNIKLSLVSDNNNSVEVPI